jgi:beta-glucosidase
MENLHDELVALLGAEGTVTHAPGYGEGDAPDSAMIREARETAAAAGVAVVVVGLPASYEMEGADRSHINLPPAHDALVSAVLDAQPRTVVVLINGSAVAMPWAVRAPAIIEGWLGGQGGGGALAEVLLGRVNPSGKLAETFPARLEDTPAYLSFPGDGTGRVDFAEGLFTGYRWYDARGIAPLFPFGHGLSYTSFAYSDLVVDEETLADRQSLVVSLTVRNTGSRAGREVVQLYVRERGPRLRRPELELKAFSKVELMPGEAHTVRFTLDERAFTVYDPRTRAWAAGGAFDLLVGASSRDIRLQQSISRAPSARPLPLTRFSPLREWLAHPAGRAQVAPVLTAMRRQFLADQPPPPGDADMMNVFVSEMPIGKLVIMGALTEPELLRMISAANEETSGG